MKSKIILCILILAALSYPQIGFTQEEDALKEIIAHPLNDTKLELDGRVDEEFWMAIAPSGDFKMTVPIEGGTPSQRTEIRIAYDEENLYIGAILFDSDPSGIKAFQKKRDASLRTDDRFMMIFDTFNDGQDEIQVFRIPVLGGGRFNSGKKCTGFFTAPQGDRR